MTTISITYFLLVGAVTAISGQSASFSKCDVNQDGVTNVSDVQRLINEALGGTTPANDLTGDGVVNVVDVQTVTNAVLGLGCAADTGSGSAPHITATAAPPANAVGWNNSNVTVTFSCTGGTAPLTCPPPILVSTETAGQVVSGTVKDATNATATASVTVKLDKTPPSFATSSPASGSTVTAASQIIAGSVIEALSGIASLSCNGAPATLTAPSFTCSVSLTSGSNSINLSATDVAGNTGTSTLTLTYAPVPTITLSAPANLSYLNITPTTVNGTVSDLTATVTINGLPAPVGNGSFSIALPLAEGPNIITATATTPAGASGTASIQVTLDTTPPHVTITSPSDQFVTTSSSISVAGSVNDTVVGTVNSQQATVKVNSIASQVANRTFLATNVSLNMGSNTIQAVAVDRAGNSATTQIIVIRQPPQPGQIQLISGNNQTGTIGTSLSAPLVVALTDASGNPAANQPVIFTVTQNNGMLSAGGAAAASVMATTNAQGQATANWTLGMRSGAGSDGVQAYSVGSAGTAVFTATANQSTPGLIVVDSGNNQTGAVNQPLPKPLIAVVVDAGHNRLSGIPVTFSVKQGGGNFGGQPTSTVNTDSDGRAAATLTLALQEGTSNNLVTADFPGDTGFPANFNASGLAPGNPITTEISGLVLDNSNQPIPGVTIRAVLTNVMSSNMGAVQAAATVQTDSNGRFTIYQAPVGFVKLLVDGSTATAPGTFPTLDYDMVTVAGQNNTVGQAIYLLPIKTNNQLCVTGTTGGGTLTIPEAPGFSLTFAPGQVTFPGGSLTGCVSVTVVHPDKVPMTPGFGQQPRFIVTIQPSGALFNPPAPITLPNVDGLAPRQVTEMYSFDHDIGSFVAIGTGAVSDDGLAIRSNPGVGVLKAGWHCGGNPGSTGAAATCPVCFFCQGTTCTPQGNGTPCGNGGTCQFTGVGQPPVCNCPAGQVINTATGTCVNPGPCLAGYTLTGGQCCQGTTCIQPSCPTGMVFDPTTGTCVNTSPCSPGYTLVAGQCCYGNNCVPPQCPPGLTFNAASGTCQSATCGSCSSGNPCIDGSCGANSQCMFSPNQLCQNACNGATSGSCSVSGVSGTCDSSGNCNLCGSLGAGASCTCGGGGTGTCSSGGQCQCGPTLQITNIESTSDSSASPPPTGVHSFLGCYLDTQFSPTIICSDTVTVTATVTGGQPANGITFNITPTGPITDDPQQVNTSTPNAEVFSGLSTRVAAASNSRSACAPVPGSWTPGPTAVVCPSPALVYNVTANATVNGMPLSASMPSGQSIQQDTSDIIREEYVDFGNTVFLPSRIQIHPPPFVVFNWSYYQNPNLIAVDGPTGADIMGSILADLQNNFGVLFANLDVQVVAPGTQNVSGRNVVAVQPRSTLLTIYDISANSKIAGSDNDVSWTGNTDPEGADLCDKWLAPDGTIITTTSHNPPTNSPMSVCIGNILIPPNSTAATHANNRKNLISTQFLFSVIHSAYRNPQKQVDLGSTINSYHTRGRALDFAALDGFAPSQIPGKTSDEVRCLFQAAALNKTSTWLSPGGQSGWKNIEGTITELFSENAAQITGFTHCDNGASDHLHIAR